MALYKGVGYQGVFEAAGHEPVGNFHEGVSGRGESDVEGDVDVRGYRHGVERGDEEAGHLGEWWVRAVVFDCWCGLDALGFRQGGGGFLFVTVLVGDKTGCDDGEGMRRGAHQVSDMNRDCRSSGFVSDGSTGFKKGGNNIHWTPIRAEHGHR